MGSPLMYETEYFGGKKAGDNLAIYPDDHTNILDLDPQEVSFDFEPYLLNTAQGVPNPQGAVTSTPLTSSSQSTTVSLNIGIFSSGQDSSSVFQTNTQMPSVQLFVPHEEPAIPKNIDLCTDESSVDIQALLAYTGLNIKNEKADLAESCCLENFQAELELASTDSASTGTASIASTSQGTPSAKDSAPGPTRKGKSKKRFPTKGSEEYVEKRARNNIAVRKSRTKAKQRQVETEGRVKILTDENERLQKKVDLLSKELNVLKSLFLNVGAALPADFESVLQK